MTDHNDRATTTPRRADDWASPTATPTRSCTAAGSRWSPRRSSPTGPTGPASGSTTPGVESSRCRRPPRRRDGCDGTVHDGLFGTAAGHGVHPAAAGRDAPRLLRAGRPAAGDPGNTDLAALPSYPQANWHRGAASGGGLYPVTVYWVAGAGGPVLPGVYHYAPHQHALRPLLTGDVAGEVRAALGGERARPASWCSG